MIQVANNLGGSGLWHTTKGFVSLKLHNGPLLNNPNLQYLPSTFHNLHIKLYEVVVEEEMLPRYYSLSGLILRSLVSCNLSMR